MRPVITLNRPVLQAGIIATLIFAAFWCGVFFRGFDEVTFAPALLSITVAAGLALFPVGQAGWRFPKAPVAIFLGLFWAWMALSLTWTTVPYVSTLFFMTIGTLPFLFFTVMQGGNADRIIAWLWGALGAAAYLLAIWASLQFFLWRDMTGARIHHPMLNANNLAVILSMGFFLMLYYFCRLKTLGQVISGVGMVLMVVGVMATQSRGGSLGVVAGSVLFAVLCWPLIRQNWREFIILSCAFVLIITAISLETIATQEGQLRLAGGGDAGASVENRYMLWGSAVAMLRDQMSSLIAFLGPGLGVFYLVFPKYRDLGDISDGYFLHVDPIQFGLEMSPIASLIFYTFGIAVLVRMINAVRCSDRSNISDRIILVVPFCGLLSLMINAHVNFDLYMIPALLFGAVLLMMWYRGTENILGENRLTLSPSLRQRRPVNLVVLMPVLVGLFVLLPVWVVRAGIAVKDAEVASIALQQGNMDAARDAAAHAIRYGPESYYRIYYIDSLWRGRVLQELFYSLDANQRRALFDDALAALDLSMKSNPYNAQAISHRALLHYVAYPRLDPNGHDRAIEILRQGLRIDPVSFDLRMGLARMLELKGQPAQALAVLEEGQRYAVTQRFAPPDYIRMQAQLKHAAGDPAAAGALMRNWQARQTSMIEGGKAQAKFGLWLQNKIDGLLQR
jgi:tetratricopeptide (TPR) repeat protein